MAIQIGSSKTSGLIEKVSSTSLRSVDYGDSKPLITKKLPEASGSNKNSWFDLEVKYPVQARVDDVERVSKLLLKLQGIKWEGHTAALETLQGNLETQRTDPSKSTMGARSGNSTGFWQKLGSGIVNTLKNAGLALVSSAGMTASTLTQVATAGTGEHQEPFLGKSYLQKGTIKSGYGFQVLNSLLSSFGFGGLGNLSGAQAAQAGTEIIGNPKYGFVEGTQRVANSKYSRVTDFLEGDPTNTFSVQDIVRPSTMEDSQYGYSRLKGYVSAEANPNDRRSNLIYRGSSYDTDNTRDQIHQSSASFQKYGEEDSYLPSDKSDFAESSSVYLTEDSGSSLELKKPATEVRRRTENVNEYTDNQGLYTWSRESRDSAKNRYTSEISDEVVVRNTLVSAKPSGSDARALKIFSISQKEYPLDTYLEDTHGEENESEALQFESNFNLIPFDIQTITPEGKRVLHFQANLDSYDDSYNADWSATSYVGRADKFYTYGGFTRDINFGFKVVALSSSHLYPIYKQLNVLAASTAPSYGEDALFMKGTLVRVTIGDLLYRQYGFVKSIKLSWDTDVPWEIDRRALMVPHMLSVSVSFTPVHTFNPTSNAESLAAGYFGHVGKVSRGEVSTGNVTETGTES